MAVTSSNDVPVTVDVTRYPVYATKAAILTALEEAVGGGKVALWDVIRRLSNTDTSVGISTDKGSTVT